MSILCQGDTHVFQLGSPTCDCGAWGASTTSLTKPYPLSGGFFPGYNPFGPPTPPTAGDAPDVSIAVFKAAKDAGASHLSADGLRIYTVRYGQTLEAEWKERLRNFGAWSVVAEIPGDAVAM